MIKTNMFDSLPESQKQKLLDSLTEAHNILALSKFRKTSNKRKQQPLHPYRKSKVKKQEHTYMLLTNCQDQDEMKMEALKQQEGEKELSGKTFSLEIMPCCND